jgi:ring-1,2-phenylacetyl-CoA epoxidase subunit PaaC
MFQKKNTDETKFPHRGTGGCLFLYTLHLADNALIIGQRNSEWTGHGPVLEQDIAITNISLDYLGLARNFYQYAASLYNNLSADEKQAVDKFIPRLWKEYGREMQEDDLAFLRDEHQYLNLLITELPKGDWAQTILRQFFFSAFQFYLYSVLEKSSDIQLSAIAEKSIKEVVYHLRWSSEWVIRLGDGTDESNKRINEAISNLWTFTGEMFAPAPYELIDPLSFKDDWMKKVETVFREATVEIPKAAWTQSGGKVGKHTEYMGYLLSEMQYLQRAYPNNVW